MLNKEELLKCIWHAFTALDVDQRGTVSKSQLKVLTSNLCAVMKIPFDPSDLEKHLIDKEPGPLSNQGYMPYLSNCVLIKLQEDNLNCLELFKFCWGLCYKKNLSIRHLHISHDDAFKVWCIFNLISEPKYPLYIVTQEVEYLLKLLTDAMGGIWMEEDFAEYRPECTFRPSFLTVWELIELVGIHFFKDKNSQTLSTAINEVFEELILGILKQGYMVKRGQGKGKNLTEYWFVLRPNSLEYYVSEDKMEIKGMIAIDSSCIVESLPDKDGRSYVLSIKSGGTSFEISASDKMKKKEWIRDIEKCIQIQKLGLLPPQRQARDERREQRQRKQEAEDKLREKIKELQENNESTQRALEALEKRVEDILIDDEKKVKTELDGLHLDRETMVHLEGEEQVEQKLPELENYFHNVKELEDRCHTLQEALEDERQAKRDQESVTELQARLLEEEALKRAELEQMHLQQQRALSQSQAQRRELEAQMQDKERRLQEATQQLERLEMQRDRAAQHHELQRLELVTNKRSKNIVTTNYEGLLRLIEPGPKGPLIITNWGPAAFTEGELEMRKQSWQKSRNWSVGSE